MPREIPRRQMFQYVRESTILINDGKAKGSAFLMQMTGASVVCTAEHVFSVTPSLYGLGPKVNPNLDFALLTEADNLGYGAAKFNYGSPNDVEPGDTVYYGGCPFSASTPHVYMGTISAIDDDLLGRRSIKIDGTAVRGMSGGPIFVQKYDEDSDTYIPMIIGFLASETFDPVDQFEEALRGLAFQVGELETRETHNRGIQEDTAIWVREAAKINRGYFYTPELDEALSEEDPDGNYKTFVWDDLQRANILTEEGRLNIAMLSAENVRLALRDEYKPHVALVMTRLEALHAAVETRAEEIEVSGLLGAISDEPTDHLVRVGMSLVNSISTGIVTGYFIEDALRNLAEFGEHAAARIVLDDEFEIGREYDRLFSEKRGVADANVTDEIIHAQIIAEVTRMAGNYGRMLLFAKQGKVESDHFPPKSVYKKARDAHIKRLPQSAMASLNLRYADHRAFITTGSRKEAVAFRRLQEQCFAQGNYCAAIEMNLEEYKKADLITSDNKPALVMGLSIHVENHLITEAEKAILIEKYSLVLGEAREHATVDADDSGVAVGSVSSAAAVAIGLFGDVGRDTHLRPEASVASQLPQPLPEDFLEGRGAMGGIEAVVVPDGGPH